MTSVGTAEAEPGETSTGRLAIGETPDGTPVGLPVAVINGTDSGDTLYIQAGSDGDELNGIGVVRELVPQLDPAEISGTIIVTGIANYHGFQVHQHRNPIDDTKLNRVYPGNETGTSSERFAHATFQVASQADLILDLHQGSTSRMLNETRIRCGQRHRLHDACMELAKVFDCGYVLDQKGPEGQLARVATDKGIPTIDPELGGAVGWDDESIEYGVTGIKNVLAYYGFVDGDVQLSEQTRATGFDRYNAPRGGLVEFQVGLGDRVRQGDTVFRVTDVFGSEKTVVHADRSGIFWRCRRLPQVATGEYVCSVGTNIDQY